ncbi:MAG: hypothetical protein ABSF25_16335 [Bryobacteraceae bacterium]|jgi:hypothetical protein
MAISNKKSKWRVLATIGFLVLLALTVGLCATAVGMALRGGGPWTIFPEDSPPALRFVVLLVGLAAAWVSARQTLEVLVSGEVEVAAAVTAAWSVAVFLLLLFVVLVFSATIHWGVLLLLLLLVLILAAPAFSRLVGASRIGLIVAGCLIAGGVAVYLMARA